MSEIFVRLVPANPFDSCNFIIPMLEISEQDVYRSGIQTDDGEILRESDLCTDTRCYPLINETSLYFVVRLRTVYYLTDSFNSKTYHLIDRIFFSPFSIILAPFLESCLLILQNLF